MPKPTDRFYLLTLPTRPVWWGDIGQRLTITGVILEGEGVPVIIKTPDSSASHDSIRGASILEPTSEEWSEIIRHSDDPSVFELDATGGIKAIHRKLRYAISGDVQQKIWARDGFKCVYCNRMMGVVQLTIDHFYPLETGGKNDETNYLSACRKCNKRKGNTLPEEWCRISNLDFQTLLNKLR